jgi:hypothetical protein
MYARIINNTVAEIVSDEMFAAFPADIKTHFQPAADGMVYRATLVNGVWVAPPEPDPIPEPSEPAPVYSKSMTPIRFKLALGQSARLAIRNAVAYDGADAAELTKKAILTDWWDILNDKTLVEVSVEDPDTIAALGYLVTLGFLTEAKKDEILMGVLVG